MANVIAVVSYDLKKVGNSHEEFKKEMKKVLWKFERAGKPLPNTTCWARFNDGIDEKSALRTSEYDVKTITANLKKIIPGFTLESYYIICFMVPDGEITSWSL